MKRSKRRHPDSLRLALDKLILAQAGFVPDSRERSREFGEWLRKVDEMRAEIREV